MDETQNSIAIGPKTRRDPTYFVLLTLCAAGWLWIAYDLHSVSPSDGMVGVAGWLAIAAASFLVGAATWWFSPFSQGRLEITTQGLNFEQWKGRRIAAQSIPWARVAAIRTRQRPRGRTLLGIVARPRRSGAAAQVWWLDLSGLDTKDQDVVEIMLDAGSHAGFSARVRGGEVRRAREQRWDLYPTSGQVH